MISYFSGLEGWEEPTPARTDAKRLCGEVNRV